MAGVAPEIAAIRRLKRETQSIILAQFQTPEIFHGVADIVGDSLALRAKPPSQGR